MFLSPYAFSGVEYVNWICSFILLPVQKPGKRKSCTIRPLSVKALPYNRWKSCLVKGSPTWPKSLQSKSLPPLHHRHHRHYHYRHNCHHLHHRRRHHSPTATTAVSGLLAVRLLYCKTVSLSNFQTDGLLDCLTVLLSDCHTIILSDGKTVWLFYCQTVRVSECQTV